MLRGGERQGRDEELGNPPPLYDIRGSLQQIGSDL